MCSEINIIVLLSLLVLSGCQTPNIEDTSSEAATDFVFIMDFTCQIGRAHV